MNTLPAAPMTQSALDFDGLGKLRAEARQNDKAAVRETAQQFEALFIQMMMKSMRESVSKDEENGSNGQETFESMFDREVAHGMARRNSMGLADMLVRDHAQRSQMVSTADALQGRAVPPARVHELQPARPGLALPANTSSVLPLPGADSLKPLHMPAAPLAGADGGQP